MSNTIEAAEMIEANIKRTNDLVEKMCRLAEGLELDGTEDLTELRANIQGMKDIIAKNEATAKYIRKTAEDE